MMMSSFQHLLKINFNNTIVKVSPFMMVEMIKSYNFAIEIMSSVLS